MTTFLPSNYQKRPSKLCFKALGIFLLILSTFFFTGKAQASTTIDHTSPFTVTTTNAALDTAQITPIDTSGGFSPVTTTYSNVHSSGLAYFCSGTIDCYGAADGQIWFMELYENADSSNFETSEYFYYHSGTVVFLGHDLLKNCAVTIGTLCYFNDDSSPISTNEYWAFQGLYPDVSNLITHQTGTFNPTNFDLNNYSYTNWYFRYKVGSDYWVYQMACSGGSCTPIAPPSSTSCPTDHPTCIIDFTPEDGASITTATPITFTLDANVDASDLTGGLGVTIFLHNIDQNVLLARAFSPNDIILLDNYHIETAGPYHFSSDPITLADGNYRLQAKLTRNFLSGIFLNPFSSINQTLNHQFIVGSASFIGNISQNTFDETQAIIGAYNPASATASQLAGTCNPLGDFDVIKCLTFLWIPDGKQLTETVTNLKDGVLNRVPWGYFTRVYTIFADPASATLPTYNVDISLGSASETTNLAFDPGDMLAGASGLLDNIHGPHNGATVKGTFEPIVKLVVALAVLFTIVSDVAGTHKHNVEGGRAGGKLS